LDFPVLDVQIGIKDAEKIRKTNCREDRHFGQYIKQPPLFSSHTNHAALNSKEQYQWSDMDKIDLNSLPKFI